MRVTTEHAFARAVASAAVLVSSLLVAACGSGESGIAPPTDRFFYPSAVAVDSADRWLYVVNSNSNLRYNAGTVLAVDLDLARADRTKPWGVCPSPSYVAEDGDPTCCRDYFDHSVLNCRERPYLGVNSAGGTAAVRIGSFGTTALLMEPGPGTGGKSRLFVGVRGDPSLTFIDLVQPTNTSVDMICSLEAPSATETPTCSLEWEVRKGKTGDTEIALLEEPFTMTLDPTRRILYVGHLTTQLPTTELGGISVIDVCGAGPPRLASVNRLIFTSALAQSVTTLTVANGGAELYATSRLAPEVGNLRLRDPASAVCDGSGAPRPLELVSGQSFFSTAFALGTVELRGFLLSPDGNRAYVLHRNVGRDAPPAIAVIDRTPDPSGHVANQTISVIEVCSGATEMRLHDVGSERGPRIFVTCFESGQIYVVDPARLTVTNVIDVGRGPNTIAFPTENSQVAYVSGFADNDVSVIDLRPGSRTEYRVVQRIGFPRPQGTQSN